MRTVRLIGAAVAAMLALLASGCDTLDQPGGVLTRSAALAQLDRLGVAPWTSMAGYSRERFPHWSGQGDGCDTRDVVLKRDGTSVSVQNPCKITNGSWFSVYDGATRTDPADVDIDHMVPLANAWRTGAATWSEQRREEFANDLDRPQLIAVTAESNRSKGDQDPSQWQPPRQEYWCAYAQQWVAVKSYWQLSVTSQEKAALAQMLDTCS